MSDHDPPEAGHETQPLLQRVDRYPGLQSFGVEAVDTLRFFGRQAEAQELVQRIRANRLWVLYGKSGFGKTSLLQAGVFPQLSRYHLIPLRMRFTEPSRSAMQVLRDALVNELPGAQSEPLVELADEVDSWWAFFSRATFWDGEHLATPLLVLDQFEELFTMHESQQSRLGIAREIDTLVSGLSASAMRDQLKDARDQDAVTLSPKPDVRVLLSLRTEYVGQLQELFPALPSVLSRRTLLGALATEDARVAIVEPARLEDERLATPPFHYADDALESLLSHLVDQRDHVVEPYQLQLYCAEIERKIAAQHKAQSDQTPLLVSAEMVGQQSALKSIMLRHVDRAIDDQVEAKAVHPKSLRLPGWRGRYRRSLRRLLERDLLTPSGNRHRVEAAEIAANSMLDATDLDALVDLRLLRKEPRGSTYVYEITHDSLARTLFEHRPAPLSPVVRRSMIAGALALGAVAGGFALYSYRVVQQEVVALRGLEATANAAEERIVALELDNTRLQKSIQSAVQGYSRQSNALVSLLNNEETSGSSSGIDVLEFKKLINDVERSSVELEGALQTTHTSLPLPDMVEIKAGEFLMGSEQGRSNEKPVHRVTIDYAFEIGVTEVTFAQYDAFAVSTKRELPNDRGWGRGDRPVINVSKEDAQAYIDWLNEQTEGGYRLPTESEWEYAARAGTTTAYWWGDKIDHNRANCGSCGSQWDDKQTAPVKSFTANPWGLYDTAGNVYEWVEDCWHDTYEGAPSDGSPWLNSCTDETRSPVRGGSWFDDPGYLRAAFRGRVPHRRR